MQITWNLFSNPVPAMRKKRPRKPIAKLPLAQTDGGRAATGFAPTRRDCVSRAIAIATGRPYAEVWNEMKPHAPKGNPDRGVYTRTSSFDQYMQAQGFTAFTSCLSPKGRAGRVKLRKGDLPAKGTLVVQTKGHLQTVIDGVLHDTFYTGTPSVRGYWTKN